MSDDPHRSQHHLEISGAWLPVSVKASGSLIPDLLSDQILDRSDSPVRRCPADHLGGLETISVEKGFSGDSRKTGRLKTEPGFFPQPGPVLIGMVQLAFLLINSVLILEYTNF